MGLHVAQMTSPTQMAACFDAVTVNGAKVLGLQRHGVAVGCEANLVLLQARSVVEALRLRPNRLLVLRQGKMVACSAPAMSQLDLPGRPASVDWTLQR
jgi:cytosine deaminase